MGHRNVLKAVLFDLDDTLFDHRWAARAALGLVHGDHACFTRVPFEEFERMHASFLEDLHRLVVAGTASIEAARIERFRRLFDAVGVRAENTQLTTTAESYRQAYISARRPIDGARALLAALKPHVRIGIVSNNLLAEQRGKIQLCGFDPYIDELVVSEEARVSKPDPAIFHLALERIGCTAEEALMVGDSWSADVEGAYAAGIRTIWFNRLGLPMPDSPSGVALLTSLDPIESVLHLIFGTETGDRNPKASACGLA